MKRRVLVTGVTGALGRQVAKELRGQGHALFGAARDPLVETGQELSWLPIACDLRDGEAARRAVRLSQPDLVINLAAAQASATWTPQVLELYATNLIGSCHLLTAVAQEVPGARVILVGSGAEYGPTSRPRRRFAEDAPLLPATDYAASKAAAGLMALAFAKSHGLDLILVRLFNLIGPTRTSASAAAWFARQIAEAEAGLREPVLRCGNLRAERDFLDYRDAARALALLAGRPLAHPLYNICSGKGLALGDLVAKLLARSRCPGLAVHAAEPPPRLDRLVGDPRRFQGETGWAPAVSLEASLDDLLEHWRAVVARREGP